jgi:hypothetical protein
MRDFLLGNEWLEEAVDRFAERGWSEEQITEHVNAWADRVVAYVLYLMREGYGAPETVRIVNAAVDKADFDLSKMPVIP